MVALTVIIPADGEGLRVAIERISRKSFNLVQERYEKLRELFPEVFTEGKIDFTKLRAALGDLVDDSPERYLFTWAGKSEAIRSLQIPSRATLIPCEEESINFEEASHIFIEGENLEVLKLLLKSYYGRVKMVYIDPPYNTGEDFIYKDDYKDPLKAYLIQTGQIDEKGNYMTSSQERSGRYHSAWLSMMYPRLFLARQLLREDGLLVVHIDEHEVAHLQLLLNEIFGEENCLGTIIWDKMNPKGDAKGVSYQHESILLYAKHLETFTKNCRFVRPKPNAQRILKKARELYARLGKKELPRDLESCMRKYNLPLELCREHIKTITLEDINAEFKEWLKSQKDLSGGEAAYCRIDEKGQVYRLVSMAWPNKKKAPEDYFVPLIHPVTGKPCPVPKRGWRYPTKTMQELLANGEIVFGPDEKTQPQRKYLLKDNMEENIPSVISYGGSDDDLLEAMGIPFDNPKPVFIVKQLIKAATNPTTNDIIIDFFAGSCTTAHAVLELNAEDGGNRQFIMVELPVPPEEPSVIEAGFATIAEIGKERIRRVIRGYGENPQPMEGVGFKVFKLAPSNFKQWEDYTGNNPDEYLEQLSLFQNTLVDGYRDIDIIYEVILKEGYDLNSRIERVESVTANTVFHITDPMRNQAFYLCLDEKVYIDALEPLALKEDDLFICLDTALDDTAKANLALQCRLKTI